MPKESDGEAAKAETGSSESRQSLLEAFHEGLKTICKKLHHSTPEFFKYDANQLDVEFAPGFPMWLRINFDPKSSNALLVGVVRTVGFAGARSDYHDLISIIWGACLRANNIASVRLIDIPHPVIPGELYGRYLVFEKQPSASYISLEAPNFELLEQIIRHSCGAAQFFSTLYQVSDGDTEKEFCASDGGEWWAEAVTKSLNWKIGNRWELRNQRFHPNWCYYRRNDRGIAAFALCVNPLEALSSVHDDTEEIVLEGNDQYLVKSGLLKNTIDKKSVATVFKLLVAYGIKAIGRLSSLVHNQSIQFLPTDTHLICVTAKGIIAIESEGDDRNFRIAEASLLERHQKEARLLHSSVRFTWKKRLDDDRFEEMMREVLIREPGVTRVRRVGTSRASDGERDLVADWIQSPAPWEAATEQQAFVLRRVIVQCKAFSGSVNRTKVGDVPGTVDLHGADGYLLIAFPRITPPLFDYLSKVPAKRKIWADWWTQSEIEDRLRKNLDVAERYTDLVSVLSNPAT